MKVNEIFYSLQGEGVRAGTANVFVRFARCNLRCRVGDEHSGFDCDTEFESFREFTPEEILAEARRLAGETWSPGDVGVIFTGGEPALQLTAELVALFRNAGFFTAIETNGTVNVAALGLDWITVSPKSAGRASRSRRWPLRTGSSRPRSTSTRP